MTMSNPLLDIRNLSVEYRTDNGVVYAVNDVSLQVGASETLGLVGETGAGKTTIAKSILRLLAMPPAAITGGEILFQNEQDLLKLSEREMRKVRGNKIAMIFQDPMSALDPVFTVGDQVSEGIQLHRNVKAGEAKEIAIEILGRVGIAPERFFDYPHQFSGGMKQRVVIAMALSCNPLLLLADEPTTALDVTIQAQVLDLMRDLKNEMQTATIMISHDLGVIAKTCDKVAIIYAGAIMEYGSKRQVFKAPAHPYTNGLFSSLPSIQGSEKRLKPIPGLMPDPSTKHVGCPFRERCERAQPRCEEPVHPTDLGEGHIVCCINPIAKGGGQA